MAASLIAQELPQLGFGVGLARFHDEIGLTRNGCAAFGCATVAVALGEAVEGYAAHEKLLEYAIHHIIYPTCACAFIVEAVAAIEGLVAVVGERRIAIDLEIGGENLFTNHLAESLTTGLHAVTFEAVAEDFMKEDTAGLATHQRRTREGICNRSFGQRLETAPDIFGIANHDVLTGQRIERSGIVGLVKGHFHTVVGLDLGLNEDAIADAVLYDGSTLGAHEMRSLILHLEVSNSLSELWPLTEDGTDAAETLFPFALFGRGEGGMGEGRLIIGLGDGIAEHRKAGSLILVVGL